MNAVLSRVAVVMGFALLAAPRIASAESSEIGVDARPRLLTEYGETFHLAGGVTNFIEDKARNMTDVGGVWEARLGFGSRFYVGGELAYVGSARKIRATGIDSTLAGNGIEGDLRINYPYATGKWLVEPFAFGGIGWSHVTVNGLGNDTALMKASNDIAVVPVGAGVAVGYDHIQLEGRFTYRQTFNEDLVRGPDGGNGSLKSWAAGASVGYEF